jgi:regulator of nucleoside diphosphate kinase
MAQRDIFLTEDDWDRLQALLSGTGRTRRDREHVEQLASEIERANIVSPDEIPADVVTMHSEVELKDLDTGEVMVFRLVYPSQADADHGRVSVLAPIGTAVIGYRAGDTIEWTVPGGTRRLQIGRVLYQPEAAGVRPE